VHGEGAGGGTVRAVLAGLVESARRGDEEAFIALVRRLGPGVRSLLTRLAGPAAADDLVQEAFFRAWRELATYRPDRGAFSTWVYRIALNAARDHLRRGRVRGAAEGRIAAGVSAAGPPPAAEAGSPEGAAARREEEARVRAAVDALPEPERAVVLLHVHGGLSFREAAEALGCPVTTAKNRFAAALRRLREGLRERAGIYFRGGGDRRFGGAALGPRETR